MTLAGAGPSPAKDVPCAYCDTSVLGAAFVLCAVCEVPVHRDCWQEGGACPAYACGNTRALDPAEALFRKPGAAMVVDHASGQASRATASSGSASGPPASGAELVVQAVRNTVNAAVSLLSSASTALTRSKPLPPALVPLSQAERALEIRRLEVRLRELELRRWKRNVVIVAGILLAPLVLRFIARPLVFPWLLFFFAFASWPGFRDTSRRHEKALRARLEQLELNELGG